MCYGMVPSCITAYHEDQKSEPLFIAALTQYHPLPTSTMIPIGDVLASMSQQHKSVNLLCVCVILPEYYVLLPTMTILTQGYTILFPMSEN